MTCPTTTPFDHGTPLSDLQPPLLSPTLKSRTKPLPSIATNPLERLAQLVNDNDRLMDELTSSRARIVAARTYLDRPGCNARFGNAHLARSRDKHTGILAQLRSNRIEALRLLGEGGPES